MKKIFICAAFAIPVVVLALGCGGSPAAPVTPTTPPPLNFAGTWDGTGSDSQGRETLTWVLTQTGNSFSGTVTTAAFDPTDGSCASCHKNKVGTVSGTISGGGLVVTMVFPTGGDVPTPICSVAIDASAPAVSGSQIVANYSGADSCEGPFVDGAFTMVKRDPAH